MEVHSYQWRWGWIELCGADGLNIWSEETHDIGLCFEQLCLQIPALAFLAITSAYYFGHQVHYVIRGKTQLLVIKIRCIIVFLMVALPIFQTYIDLNNRTEAHVEKITYFLAAVEGTAWLTHLGYLLVLRKRLGISPRGPVFICVLWTLIAVLSIISLRTNILIYNIQNPSTFSTSLAYSFSIIRVILQILYALTLIPSEGTTVYLSYSQDNEHQPLLSNNPYSRFVEERDPNYLGVAMEDSTWLSKLLFYWVNSLMKKGVDGKLNSPDDLYDLPDSLDCTMLSLKLEKALIGNIDDMQKIITEIIHHEPDPSSSMETNLPIIGYDGLHPRVSLLRALHKCFWLQFYGIGILRLLADTLGFAGPILLNKLVSFIENRSEDVQNGYLYATGLMCTTLLSALFDTHFNYYMTIVGLKIRTALVTAIYRKTISTTPTDLAVAFSIGEIINFMSTDTDRIVNSCPSFHAFWSIPFQIIVSLYLLYNQVGFAFVGGVAFSILLIPINKMIATKIGQISTKMMACKDERVKIMTEVLRGIRSIKVHVWEEHFAKTILKIRNGELKYLKCRKYLDALCVYFWATTPVVISILTFGTYVLMGNKLSAATVFTSMALVNMLISPLNAFPWVLNGITEAWVSIKRIQRLLDLHDLNVEHYYNNSIFNEYPQYNIIIKNGFFNWGKQLTAEEIFSLHKLKKKNKGRENKSVKTEDVQLPENVQREFKLSNINILIKKGEFVGVMGVVGSGKSSLLSAVLAEMGKEKGLIAVADLDEGFGLVAQQPWLQRGTVRDNILFGKTFDREKYKRIVHACGLDEDLALLPGGDLTGVGEGGTTLSGGQKARVALARAVYQENSVYLLDDVVSAVDGKVAKHIFKFCIMGLLKTKTRILCTHHVKYLVQADSIIVMDNGRVKQQGKPSEILSNIDEFLPIDLELENSIQSDNSSSLVDSIDKEDVVDDDSLLDEENRETGTVKTSVYIRYWSAMGNLLGLAIVLSLILMQSSRNVTDWWLSYWVSNEKNSNNTNSSLLELHIGMSSLSWINNSDEKINSYLIIYVCLAFVNSLFTLFRAFLFAYGGVSAANKIHKQLLRSVIWSKISFFDISPLGRIINRFSSDTYTTDDSLPFILNILLAQLFGVIGSVILTIYGLPWLCLVLVPLIPVYHWLQNYYRLTSRELKRLSSVTMSPIYSHFNETVHDTMDSKKPAGKKRTLLPPRIPTPMPPPNNSNSIRSSRMKEQNTKVHPSSVGSDIPKLISKDSYKLLDNDVGTAWINPRLISKVNMYDSKSREYILPELRNMNGYFNRNLAHQKQGCGRSHDREWESTVNGRTKPRVVAVPTLIQYVEDAKRDKINRKSTRTVETHNIKNINSETKCISIKTEMASIETFSNYNRAHINAHSKSLTNQSKTKQIHAHQFYNRSNMQRPLPVEVQKVKEVLGYQSTVDYVEGGIVGHDSGVYGMYSETRYAFAVNGIAGNPAQTSAAAAFFARAAQKLNLSSSPHRRKRHNSDDVESSGFCGVLQRCPPPVPPALLRRIGVKEVSGVGKVKVMLRVSMPPRNLSPENGSFNKFFNLDKRKKQVTLVDPSTCGTVAPEDRRVGVAAPKMFAFDAIFSQDDSQTEVCSSALTDVIHAVINGTDGCLFCFGHAGLGKSYTMLGTSENANTLGIIPCAISWLFRAINEQKQKTGARFSVRVSAVEVSGAANQLRDLLAGYSNDSEQSPGVYLRDDPLFGNQPPHCELRVPTAERAAHYLDIAVESRAPTKEETRNSHLLFTLHVYQYSVAGKGGVAGGRSRLHLFDLGNSERGKSSGGIPLSGLGNILLAIFNGQKHLPYKEHKLTHILKDCLNSLTCHAAMIAHVSSCADNYLDTLTTVQLASRIHRMRRRRIKFVSAGVGNGSGGSSGEEATRTTGTSSEPDPSSSDLSADTVIYVGPTDDATDGEHPPVYIPSLNSGDNRCAMNKALRGSTVEQRLSKVPILQKPVLCEEKSSTHRSAIKYSCQTNKTSPAHTNSPKSSPARIPSTKSKTQSVEGAKHSVNGGSDEHWIDGPRISKSKVAEARHLMKEPCHIKKRETWIDGPMHAENSTTYGYMDNHKKNMIRKWVEHQTSQIQRKQIPHNKLQESKTLKETFKELTQFKTYDDIIKPLDSQKHENIEESFIRTGLKLSSGKLAGDAIPECLTPDDREETNICCDEDFDDEEEAVEIPPALPLIQPLSSREVSLESLDNLLKERLISSHLSEDELDENICSDEEDILEMIEVEEPLEPVPTQDCCLQVTEEDIAFCMGIIENPLPEVDQDNPLDHPLRILSQENLTVVSTFTDSMSVYTDLERILPRHRYDPKYRLYTDDYEDPDNPYPKSEFVGDISQRKFNQLTHLHNLYSHSLAKATVTNTDMYNYAKSGQTPLKRCESLSLTDMLFGINGLETSSIYSEPAYLPDDEKFCENCKVSMNRSATAQNWYDEVHLSLSNNELSVMDSGLPPLGRRFQRYSHKNARNSDSLAHLRHPDGASNPNLREDFEKILSNEALTLSVNKHNYPNKIPVEELKLTRPLTPPNSLPSTERINRNIMNIESGFTTIKLNQKQSDDYDSGHDSTPRTSKHSPAAISRRAESGYDSVVRDSESSSIDSDNSRLSHLQSRRGKCKHKHDKSFCSWFLHPFTCKYIHEPPETHF